MSLNEKIKYSKKPIHNTFTDDILKEEKKQTRSCLSGLSTDCQKTIYSTKDTRICWRCSQYVERMNQGALNEK
jgi:hypothetical protein